MDWTRARLAWLCAICCSCLICSSGVLCWIRILRIWWLRWSGLWSIPGWPVSRCMRGARNHLPTGRIKVSFFRAFGTLDAVFGQKNIFCFYSVFDKYCMRYNIKYNVENLKFLRKKGDLRYNHAFFFYWKKSY